MTSGLNGLLGLALRAGKVKIGEPLQDAIQRNRVKLVIIACDVSAKVGGGLINRLSSESMYLYYSDKQNLGLLIGHRPVNAIGITDSNLASRIRVEILEKGEQIDGKKQ